MSEATTCTPSSRGVPQFLQRLKLAALASLALLAGACGGDEAALGGGPQPSACADCGTALLTVTDAPGDFHSYAVDVTSLQLVKLDGTVVETLPASTRIDFAELVDLGEVLSARQVPAGVYVAARLRVDYANAEIVVEDAAGGSLEVTAVNAQGQPVGAVDLRVQLDGRNRLVISPRRISHLAFDLNLEATNTVDLAAATVAVSPFIVASVVPPEERDWRARGRLIEVDVAGASYTIQVRPFHHHEHATGELVVHTTGATTYEIDGVAYAGTPGLAQLDTLADGTMVIAFGTLDSSDWSFTARRVLAGTSVDDLRREYLAGHVLSRDGNTLIVGGVRLHWDGINASDGDTDRRHGYFMNWPVTLLVGPGTKVTRAGQAGGTLDAGAISVGQRIQAIGDISRDGSGHLTLDATTGLVRLNYTRLAGMVTATAPGALTVDLQSIGGFRPGMFNFAGTGLTPAQDADPDAYEIALAPGLDGSGFATGSWAGVIGTVAPFGTAPADFDAVTLLNYAGARATLAVSWLPGGTSEPFSALSSAGLTLDMSAAAPPAGAIQLGGAIISLASLSSGVTVVPVSADVRRVYAIAHRSSGRIENFSDFAEFVRALDASLDGRTRLLRMLATGNFDVPAIRFDARQLLVVLND